MAESMPGSSVCASDHGRGRVLLLFFFGCVAQDPRVIDPGCVTWLGDEPSPRGLSTPGQKINGPGTHSEGLHYARAALCHRPVPQPPRQSGRARPSTQA